MNATKIRFCPFAGKDGTNIWRVVTNWHQVGHDKVSAGTFHGYVYRIGNARYENSQRPGKTFSTMRAAGQDCVVPQLRG